MAQCAAAWSEGEPLAVAEAVTWTHTHRQPIPKWLEEAVVGLAMMLRSKQQEKRYTEAGIRLRRYMTVRDLKLDINFAHGTARRITDISWETAFEKAAERLADTEAAGSAARIKSDYCKVQRDLNAGHGGRYFNLKDWRYCLNGDPNPNDKRLKRRWRS